MHTIVDTWAVAQTPDSRAKIPTRPLAGETLGELRDLSAPRFLICKMGAAITAPSWGCSKDELSDRADEALPHGV